MAAVLPGQAPSQIVEDRLARYVQAVPKPQVVPLPIHFRRPVWQWLLVAASVPLAFWLGTLWRQPITNQASAPPAMQGPAQTRIIEKSFDPNPQLRARIAELESQLTTPKVPGSDPHLAELTARLEEAERRLKQPAPAPQTVSATDP
ncbi:MAG: ABC transporter C-terminal domain-containing protein, partial [Acidobacteriota bacterium]